MFEDTANSMKAYKNIFAVLVWLVLVGNSAFAGVNSFLLKVQVSGQDRPSYVLGVLSSIDPASEMPEFNLGQKILECDAFALEYLPSEAQETIFEQAWKRGEVSLKNLVSGENYRYLETQMAAEMDMSLEAFDHFNPGVLADWISRNGTASAFDLQGILLDFARNNQKRVSVLMDAETQFSAMDNWPLDEQVAFLEQETVRWRDGFGSDWSTLVEAYRTGDVDGFQELLLGSGFEGYRNYLASRAGHYADVIASAASKGSVFAIVDARYFAGSHGLPAALASHGLIVQPVQPVVGRKFKPRWSSVLFEDGTRAELPGERFVITNRLSLSDLRPGVDEAECWMGGDESTQRTYFVGSFLLARRENRAGRESYYKQLISVLTSGDVATRRVPAGSGIPSRPSDGAGWKIVSTSADPSVEGGRVIKVRFPREDMYGVFRFLPPDEFSLEEKIHVQAVLGSSEMLLLPEAELQFFNSLRLPSSASSNQNTDSFE